MNCLIIFSHGGRDARRESGPAGAVGALYYIILYYIIYNYGGREVGRVSSPAGAVVILYYIILYYIIYNIITGTWRGAGFAPVPQRARGAVGAAAGGGGGLTADFDH